MSQIHEEENESEDYPEYQSEQDADLESEEAHEVEIEEQEKAFTHDEESSTENESHIPEDEEYLKNEHSTSNEESEEMSPSHSPTIEEQLRTNEEHKREEEEADAIVKRAETKEPPKSEPKEESSNESENASEPQELQIGDLEDVNYENPEYRFDRVKEYLKVCKGLTDYLEDVFKAFPEEKEDAVIDPLTDQQEALDFYNDLENSTIRFSIDKKNIQHEIDFIQSITTNFRETRDKKQTMLAFQGLEKQYNKLKELNDGSNETCNELDGIINLNVEEQTDSNLKIEEAINNLEAKVHLMDKYLHMIREKMKSKNKMNNSEKIAFSIVLLPKVAEFKRNLAGYENKLRVNFERVRLRRSNTDNAIQELKACLNIEDDEITKL